MIQLQRMGGGNKQSSVGFSNSLTKKYNLILTSSSTSVSGNFCPLMRKGRKAADLLKTKMAELPKEKKFGVSVFLSFRCLTEFLYSSSYVEI